MVACMSPFLSSNAQDFIEDWAIIDDEVKPVHS